MSPNTSDEAIIRASSSLAMIVQGQQKAREEGSHRTKPVALLLIQSFIGVISGLLASIGSEADHDPIILQRLLLLALECAKFYLEDAAFHLADAPADDPSLTTVKGWPEDVEPMAGNITVGVTDKDEVVMKAGFDSAVVSVPFNRGPSAIFIGRSDRWPVLVASLLETAKRGGFLQEVISVFKDGLPVHAIEAKNVEVDED